MYGLTLGFWDFVLGYKLGVSAFGGGSEDMRPGEVPGQKVRVSSGTVRDSPGWGDDWEQAEGTGKS